MKGQDYASWRPLDRRECTMPYTIAITLFDKEEFYTMGLPSLTEHLHDQSSSLLTEPLRRPQVTSCQEETSRSPLDRLELARVQITNGGPVSHTEGATSRRAMPRWVL